MAPVEQLVPGKGNFFLEELAKTGASTKKQIFGQIGLDHGPEWYSAKITHLSAQMPTDGDMARKVYSVTKADSNEPTSLGTPTVASAAGDTTGNTKITITESLTEGNSYKYKVSDAEVPVKLGQSVRTWNAWNGTDEITAASGSVITVVECDKSYNAVKAGHITVVSKTE